MSWNWPRVYSASDGPWNGCSTTNNMPVSLASLFLKPLLSTCSGKGETIRKGDECPKCHGNKTIKTPERLKIVVPAGSRDGVSLDFRGQAHQEPGLTTGDIVITLSAKPHPVYQVRQVTKCGKDPNLNSLGSRCRPYNNTKNISGGRFVWVRVALEALGWP